MTKCLKNGNIFEHKANVKIVDFQCDQMPIIFLFGHLQLKINLNSRLNKLANTEKPS